MFRSKIAIAIASLFMVPSISHAISLTDYDVPTSQWDEAYLVGSGAIRSGNQDQSSYSYTIGANYENNHTSPMQNWRMLIVGDADVSRGPNQGDERTSTYGADAEVVVENYLNEGHSTFWFGAADVGVRKEHDDPSIHVGAGIGYGRLINATPLADALGVIDELRSYGIIRGDLSRDAYLRLAQVVDRRSEFRSVHGDEYESYWYKAMEEVLQGAGVLVREGVGADGALHMRRMVEDEGAFTRMHGWDVRAGVGYQIRDYAGNKGDPTLGALFRYALPIGLQAQFYNEASYRTVFADDSDHYFSNEMSYTLELSDDIDWGNRWEVEHIRYGDSNLSSTTSNLLASGIEYDLGKDSDLIFEVRGSKVTDRDDWDLSSHVMLVYRLK